MMIGHTGWEKIDLTGLSNICWLCYSDCMLTLHITPGERRPKYFDWLRALITVEFSIYFISQLEHAIDLSRYYVIVDIYAEILLCRILA